MSPPSLHGLLRPPNSYGPGTTYNEEFSNDGWYGPGGDHELDSTKTMTVVTQFHQDDAAGGELSNITRFYLQGGKRVDLPTLCVRAWVRACVRASERTSVRVCASVLCVCVCMHVRVRVCVSRVCVRVRVHCGCTVAAAAASNDDDDGHARGT
jgi:hypothetical protein